MRYRKKPVVIEAWRVPQNMSAPDELAPVWLLDAVLKETAVPHPGTGGITIKTLEGEMVGNPGDWIIQGVKGEIYPCKPDIFEATYEAAEPPA